MAAGRTHRFRNEMEVGDTVVTYDPGRRVYLLGEITSAYRRNRVNRPRSTTQA